MDHPNFFGDYDTLLELVKTRVSVRNLKPDPIPDDYVTRILEIGRWAMSGANGQPWDFVIVKDPKIKKELFRVYAEENNDFIYWMEQQRDFKLRHPSFQMTHDEALQQHRNNVGWSIAPVLIVIVGDGRRQWATVQGAHTFGRDQSHLTDGLANTAMLMHLAAAARARQSARDHSHPGAVQAHPERARPAHVLADHADRLSGGAAEGRRAAAARRHGPPRALRHVQIHEQRGRDRVSPRAARED